MCTRRLWATSLTLPHWGTGSWMHRTLSASMLPPSGTTNVSAAPGQCPVRALFMKAGLLRKIKCCTGLFTVASPAERPSYLALGNSCSVTWSTVACTESPKSGTRYLFCCINVFLKICLSVSPNKQVQHWDGRHHEGYPGIDGGWTAAGHAEWQGNQNAYGTIPATAQGHSLLHQWKRWHQVCHGGMHLVDFARHDSSPNDSQQDTMRREHLAGPAVHLQSIHHSAIGMAPCTVKWINAECVWECLYSLRHPQSQSVLGLGTLWPTSRDWVRMSKAQWQFTKCYTGHPSKEIFHVEAMWNISPVT